MEKAQNGQGNEALLNLESEGMGEAQGSLLDEFRAWLDQGPSRATSGTVLCFSRYLLVSQTRYELLPRQRAGPQMSPHSVQGSVLDCEGPKGKADIDLKE